VTRAAVLAGAETAHGVEPSDVALDHPAVAAEALFRLDSPPSDPRLHVARATRVAPFSHALAVTRALLPLAEPLQRLREARPRIVGIAVGYPNGLLSLKMDSRGRTRTCDPAINRHQRSALSEFRAHDQKRQEGPRSALIGHLAATVSATGLRKAEMARKVAEAQAMPAAFAPGFAAARGAARRRNTAMACARSYLLVHRSRRKRGRVELWIRDVFLRDLFRSGPFAAVSATHASHE
jgi:hypothetical protein